MFFGRFLRWSNYDLKKKVQSSGRQLECFGVPSAQIVLAGSLIKLRPEKRYSCLAIGCNVRLFWRVCRYVFWRVPQSNYKLQPKKKGTVIWLAYTICNTRNILFLLCLYLKRENKLNLGIVWFEGKAPSRTSKTCLTMVEPFAGPSSMAMGNQPMPSRYPLRKRLSEGRVRGFLLTLWSGGEIFFLVNISILAWCKPGWGKNVLKVTF